MDKTSFYKIDLQGYVAKLTDRQELVITKDGAPIFRGPWFDLEHAARIWKKLKELMHDYERLQGELDNLDIEVNESS